jgi:recombination protein RecA
LESIKQGSEVMGSRVRARVVKNKVAPPFRVAEFDVMFNEGISKEGDLIDLAVDKEIVKKSGSFFSFGEDRLGQGRENAKAFLREHIDVAARIESMIRGTSEAAAAAPETPAAAAASSKSRKSR